MDSVTSGSKNGSSLPVLRGTLSGWVNGAKSGSNGGVDAVHWYPTSCFARCAERCSGCGCAVRQGCSRTEVRFLTSMVG